MSEQKQSSEQKVPGYRRQKRKGKPALGFVEINGQRRYLGEHGTPESRRRYEAAVAEWRSSGFLPPSDRDDLRILELVDRYWVHAKGYYRKPDGSPTSEADLIRRAMKPLLDLYGETTAKDFGPMRLKAVRERMVGSGWCRSNVNKMTQRIKRMFRWATENELVPANVHHALQAVAGLKQGRTEARESDPVLPAADHLVERTIAYLSPVVAAMVRLELLTGARPDEICSMRACDFNRREKVWTYKPAMHKTQHHGHSRTILLGPKAQELVQPFFKPELHAYLFSPSDAEAWHREQRRLKRKTPERYGNGPGSNRKDNPKRRPGDRYDANSYRHAIIRGCDAAFPPPQHLAQRDGESAKEWIARLSDEQRAELKRWREAHRWSPNQLRHNAATSLRAEHGIDLAQTILGHRLGSAVTEIYAEANVKKAKDIVQLIG